MKIESIDGGEGYECEWWHIWDLLIKIQWRGDAHLTHGLMFPKQIGDVADVEFVREYFGWYSIDWSADRDNVKGHCLMASTTKSPITEKVCNILISSNVSSNSYDSILSDIDDACAYLNDFLISMISDLETEAKLCKDRNKI